MRPIDADDLKVRIEMERHLTLDNQFLPTLTTFEARYIIDHMPTVDAVPVKHVITVLMDLRDEFVAKQPRSEWVNNKTAQGVEKGIEMCIARIREMAKDD